jgi:hypothetical protein
MYETAHYAALMTRLSNEKIYLAAATKESEIELRSVWIKQIEKEIADELLFLESKGVKIYSTETEMSDDDILNELFGI